MREPIVSLDAFDVPFLRTPDQCVLAWTAAAAGAPITAARQRAAMRREARRHLPMALGHVADAGEWFVFDLPHGPFDYALVRLAYDPRWRRCVWVGEARAAGFPNPATAAQAMLSAALDRGRCTPAPARRHAAARRGGRQRASSGPTTAASSSATSA